MRVVGAWLMLVGIACGSCQDFEQAPECGAVPAGGCPTSRGGSCDDKACTAVYGCTTSGWVLDKSCEREAGGDDAGSGDAGETDGPMCGEAVLMPEGSSTDCDPNELQLPDCPINVALGCPGTACMTGCLDFFVCRTGSWNEAAYCDEVTGALVWIDAY